MSGLVEFRVVSRSKTETAEGTKHRVKLKSGDVLASISGSSGIFVGYPIGERIPVDIRRARTLSAGLESA